MRARVQIQGTATVMKYSFYCKLFKRQRRRKEAANEPFKDEKRKCKIVERIFGSKVASRIGT